MKDVLKVSNIQRVCFHDGPGIRTTVFLQGCTIKCPWCANPETRTIYNNHAKEYHTDEIYDFIIKDKFLYEKNGGVTFSGGEPLIQSESLLNLMKKLKKDDINITVESAMYVNTEELNNIIDYIDLFIIDIKILNKENALEILGGHIEQFLNNIDVVFRKNKKVIFRIPLINPYITNKENLESIYDFLNKYKPHKVEIFKGHNLGKEKYKKLGLEYNEVQTISDDEILKIKNRIDKLGINIEVISF